MVSELGDRRKSLWHRDRRPSRKTAQVPGGTHPPQSQEGSEEQGCLSSRNLNILERDRRKGHTNS